MEKEAAAEEDHNVTEAVAGSAPAQDVEAGPASSTPEAGSDWLGRNIYVRCLPPLNPITGEMPSEQHVLALFSRFGEVERIKVVRDRLSNLPVGIALVLFKSPEAATNAVQTINTSNIGAVASMWLPKSVLYGQGEQ
jgi:hypothetical protein